MTGDLIGWICCITSTIAWGIMFAPLNSRDCKDGMFVQFISNAVTFVFGFVINFIRDFPPFQPLASVGGLLFTTGTIFAVPVVKGIGIGLALLIWCSVQIITGWAVARFGFFGLKPQIPAYPIMQYFGVAITLMSGVMFGFVKYVKIDKDNTFTTEVNESKMMTITEEVKINDGRFRKIFGNKTKYVLMAIFLGLVNGQMLTPVTYIMDNYENVSQNGLDYVFSHYCGIFASSLIYFVIYSIIKRNRPFLSAELTLPAVAYGFMFSIGLTLFLVSNRLLSQAISLPITQRLPGVIGACMDVFIFKTITGRNNLLLLGAAISVSIVGVVLIGLSKDAF